MLLLVDFLMLRSREYQPLLQLYQDWEVRAAVQHQTTGRSPRPSRSQ